MSAERVRGGCGKRKKKKKRISLEEAMRRAGGGARAHGDGNDGGRHLSVSSADHGGVSGVALEEFVQRVLRDARL
jgi:hypothetical protein